MIASGMTSEIEYLGSLFGDRFRKDVPLAAYTSARIGGPAAGFVHVNSRDELAQAALALWETGLPYLILGGGSNILVSDRGFSGVVILNRARHVEFSLGGDSLSIWAESGANLGLVARQAASRGLAGLAWAAGIPGTIGGAIVGNAGAHSSDISLSLLMAEILQRSGERTDWEADLLEFSYRDSAIKRSPGRYTVLSASFRMARSDPAAVRRTMDDFLAYRRETQPPGASMGSMFRNPPGDFAGRLIEAAGLKGRREGSAQISPLHANFFINHGGATSEDVRSLIRLAGGTVKEKYGIHLELEIEFVGEWQDDVTW